MKKHTIVLVVLFLAVCTQVNAYQWPVKYGSTGSVGPYGINGTIGEFRAGAAAPHFHNGVDIQTGGATYDVFAIDDGTAIQGGTGVNENVRVGSKTYVHLANRIPTNSPVIAGVTKLGEGTLLGHHVHLIDNGTNALLHLDNYQNTTLPTIGIPEFYTNQNTVPDVLPTAVGVNGRPVYGKIHILSEISSSQSLLGTTYQAPTTIGYRIEDLLDSIPVLPDNDNVHFNTLPSGTSICTDAFGNFPGHQSTLSNFYWWVTNRVQDDQIERRYWNTNLAIGQAWDGTNAKTGDQAEYPDGKYDVVLYAETIRDSATGQVNRAERKTTTVVDNFLPWVKKVQVQGLVNGVSTVFYQATWAFDGNANVTYLENVIQQLTARQNYTITVEFSEQMKASSIAIQIAGIQSITVVPLDTSTAKFGGTFSLEGAPSNTNAIITISGSDLNGNGLLKIDPFTPPSLPGFSVSAIQRSGIAQSFTAATGNNTRTKLPIGLIVNQVLVGTVYASSYFTGGTYGGDCQLNLPSRAAVLGPLSPGTHTLSITSPTCLGYSRNSTLYHTTGLLGILVAPGYDFHQYPGGGAVSFYLGAGNGRDIHSQYLTCPEAIAAGNSSATFSTTAPQTLLYVVPDMDYYIIGTQSQCNQWLNGTFGYLNVAVTDGTVTPTPTPFTTPPLTPGGGISADPLPNSLLQGGNGGSSGDDVMHATGGFYLQASDLQTLRLNRPMPFGRFYFNQGVFVADKNSYLDGYLPIGVNWSHSYNMRLILPDGSSSEGITTLVMPNGGVSRFLEMPGNSNYIGEKSFEGTLKKLPSNEFELKFRSGDIWEFDAEGRAKTIVDSNGNRTLLVYLDNQLVAVKDSFGSVVYSISYNASGMISAVMDVSGATCRYVYDVNNDLVTVTSPSGLVTTYTYDANHNIISLDDPFNAPGYKHLDNVYSKISQEPGSRVVWKVVRQLNAVGQVQYAYSYSPFEVSVTDTRGSTAVFRMDETGREVSATDPYGKSVVKVRNSNGNVTQLTDKNGFTSHFSYDDQNDMIQEIGANGDYVSYVYDKEIGKVIKMIDALRNVSTFEYDGHGNKTKYVDAEGHVLKYTNDASGQLVGFIDPNGFASTFEYDIFGNFVRYVDAAGIGKQRYSRDVKGRVSTVTNANGVVWGITYDADNWLKKISFADGSSIEYFYDSKKRLVKLRDRRSFDRTFIYDSLDRLVESVDPLGYHWHFAYDASGNLIRATNPKGYLTSYEYDALNRVTKVVDANGKNRMFTYDAMGNRIGEVDGDGIHIDAVYDYLSRMTHEAGQTYQYDANGNIVGVSTPSGMLAMKYSASNRLVKEIDPRGVQLNYTYDAAGNIKSISIDDAENWEIDYGYFPNGTIHTMQTTLGIFNFTYDLAGNPKTITYPNGIVCTLDYDGVTGDLRLVRTQNSRGEIVSKHAYSSYAGLVGSIEDLLGVSGFEYDGNGQLTHAELSNGISISYSYDSDGNRINMLRDGVNTNYNFDAADQLVSSGGVSRTYDGNGNQITVGNTQYVFAEGLLKSIQKNIPGSPLTVSIFEYDGFGRRTRKNDSSGDVSSFFIGSSVIMDKQTNDPKARYYLNMFPQKASIYGGTELWQLATGKVLGSEKNGKGYYYLEDGRGNIDTITDGKGEIVQTYSYDPFGVPINIESDSANIFGYMGMDGAIRDDADTLTWARERYYDAKIGRFISRDPFTWSSDDVRLNKANLRRNDLFVQSLLEAPRGTEPFDFLTAEFRWGVAGMAGSLQTAKTFSTSNFLNPYVFAANNPVCLNDPIGTSTLWDVFTSVEIFRTVGDYWNQASNYERTGVIGGVLFLGGAIAFGIGVGASIPVLATVGFFVGSAGLIAFGAQWLGRTLGVC